MVIALYETRAGFTLLSCINVLNRMRGLIVTLWDDYQKPLSGSGGRANGVVCWGKRGRPRARAGRKPADVTGPHSGNGTVMLRNANTPVAVEKSLM